MNAMPFESPQPAAELVAELVSATMNNQTLTTDVFEALSADPARNSLPILAGTSAHLAGVRL